MITSSICNITCSPSIRVGGGLGKCRYDSENANDGSLPVTVNDNRMGNSQKQPEGKHCT